MYRYDINVGATLLCDGKAGPHTSVDNAKTQYAQRRCKAYKKFAI